MRHNNQEKKGCLGSLLSIPLIVWSWIFSIFCLTAPLAYGFHFCSLLFILAGVASLPLKSIRNLWKRYLPGHFSKLKILVITAVFLIGCFTAPAQEQPTVNPPADLSYSAAAQTSHAESPAGISENTATVPSEDTITLPSKNTAALPGEDTAALSGKGAVLVPTEAASVSEPSVNSLPENSSFSIHFIDVGQADAALVACDGHYMLIDGGNKADSNVIYSVLKKANVPKIDIVVGTHGHEDHIGGLPGAYNYTTADLTLCPVKNYDSNAFEDFVKYADQNGGGITIPSVGDTYSLGSSMVTILGVNSESDANNSSIVLRIDYGETSFLFTGDAEREAEQVILNSGMDLSATVLKVGHHGSDTSTTYPFLREIMPQYAVISVGSGNSYGHPTENTLSRLRDAEVTVFRTDLQGDIYCTSDGKIVTFTTDRNADIDTLAPVTSNTTVSGGETENGPVPADSSKNEASAESEVQSAICWKSATGKKYHAVNNCGRMNPNKATQLTVAEAEALGLQPCSKCWR